AGNKTLGYGLNVIPGTNTVQLEDDFNQGESEMIEETLYNALMITNSIFKEAFNLPITETSYAELLATLEIERKDINANHLKWDEVKMRYMKNTKRKNKHKNGGGKN
ncbi:MAG: hypothetical protein JNL74_22060, partial [Fibrobacteres bacterium]|nr:hypothetical protein [Fibrobacterota bacterium]